MVTPVRFAYGHHVSLVVVEVPVEELRNDMRFAERAVVRSAKAALGAGRGRDFGVCCTQDRCSMTEWSSSVDVGGESHGHRSRNRTVVWVGSSNSANSI